MHSTRIIQTFTDLSEFINNHQTPNLSGGQMCWAPLATPNSDGVDDGARHHVCAPQRQGPNCVLPMMCSCAVFREKKSECGYE